MNCAEWRQEFQLIKCSENKFDGGNKKITKYFDFNVKRNWIYTVKKGIKNNYFVCKKWKKRRKSKSLQ